MLRLIIIHHKFSWPPSSLVLAPFVPVKRRNLCYRYDVSTRRQICTIARYRLDQNNDILTKTADLAEKEATRAFWKLCSRTCSVWIWLLLLRRTFLRYWNGLYLLFVLNCAHSMHTVFSDSKNQCICAYWKLSARRMLCLTLWLTSLWRKHIFLLD